MQSFRTPLITRHQSSLLLPLTLSHSHSLLCSQSQSITLAHSHNPALPHSHTFTLPHARTPTLQHSPIYSHIPTQYHIPTLTYTPTFPHSRIPTTTLKQYHIPHSLRYSHAFTIPYPHTHSLPLSRHPLGGVLVGKTSFASHIGDDNIKAIVNFCLRYITSEVDYSFFKNASNLSDDKFQPHYAKSRG
jgi:hypothetical protein